MAKFFVGQRVRVIRASCSPHLVGREAIIQAVEVRGKACTKGGLMEFIGVRTNLKNFRGTPHVAQLDNIEPIIPDGAKPGNWETLKDIWTPAKLKESV